MGLTRWELTGRVGWSEAQVARDLSELLDRSPDNSIDDLTTLSVIL